MYLPLQHKLCINAGECKTYNGNGRATTMCYYTNGNKAICPCPCATSTSSILLHSSTVLPSDTSSSFRSVSIMTISYQSTLSDNTPSRSSLNTILIGTTIAIGILLLLLTCAIISLTIAIISNRRNKQRNILHHANSQRNIYEELNRAPLQGHRLLDEQNISGKTQFTLSDAAVASLTPVNSEHMILDWSRGTDQDKPGSYCVVTKGRCPSLQSSEYETVPDVRSAYLDQITRSSAINSSSCCIPSSSVRHDLSTGQQWEYAMVSDTEACVDFKDIDVLRNQIPTGELVRKMNNGEIESEYSLLGGDNYELRCTKITNTNISKPATQQECSGKNGKEDGGPVYSVVKKNHKEKDHVMKPVASGHGSDFDDDNEVSPPVPTYQPVGESIID